MPQISKLALFLLRKEVFNFALPFLFLLNEYLDKVFEIQVQLALLFCISLCFYRVIRLFQFFLSLRVVL